MRYFGSTCGLSLDKGLDWCIIVGLSTIRRVAGGGRSHDSPAGSAAEDAVLEECGKDHAGLRGLINV